MRIRLLFAAILLVTLAPAAPAIDAFTEPPAVSAAGPLARPLALAAYGALVAGEPITIGVAAAMTGPLPDIGAEQVNAVQLRVDEVNAAGGLVYGGVTHQAVLVTADDACNSGQAATAAGQLLATGAVAVVGHTCSSASMAAAPIYYAAHTAMVSPSSTNPNLTYMGHDTTFRVVGSDVDLGRRMGRTLASQGLDRAALVTAPSSATTDGWANDFAAAYTGLGGVVAGSYPVITTADISVALTGIAAQNVDVIVVCNEAGDLAANTSAQAAARGMAQPIAWIGFGDDEGYPSAAGAAAEGDFHTVNLARLSDMPGWPPFYAAYVSHGYATLADPTSFAALAYDAAGIILAAIETAGTGDPADVRQAIAATTGYQGVLGTYSGFDAHGDVIPAWGAANVVQNGRWVPADRLFEIYAGQPASLELESTWGQTTTLTIPGAAVGQSLAITYTLVTTDTSVGVPGHGIVGEHPMRLESSVDLSAPVTLTVIYQDSDVARVKEATLALYTHVLTGWVETEACGGYVRDMAHNSLAAGLCHFSDYVLLGESKERVFAPVVEKRY